MRYALLFALLFAFCGKAAAFTGNELYEVLKLPTRDFALGYIEGVVDSAAVVTAARWTKRTIQKWTFCTPATTTRRQSADEVLKWLEARPEVRHILAHELVGAALEYSYPCYR